MPSIDQVLDKFMREVESSVHAFYRGDVRQNTQRVKTDTFLRDARQALVELMGEASGTGAPRDEQNLASDSFAPEEVAAAMRCVMAWLPMGPPSTANSHSRCVAAAREISPTWGERETARLALHRATG